MHVVADGQRIYLYRDRQPVHSIDDADALAGRMAMFAEVGTVYIRKIRVLPLHALPSGTV
jgi:hypothetical protein